MYTRRRYPFFMTLRWSKTGLLLPALWAAVVTALHELAGMDYLSLPWLPISAVAVAVAFYLGFKNNASYDRMWEARKIWGAIVNASRSWAYGIRDLVGATGDCTEDQRVEAAGRMVLRHVAWMDALRFQLRKLEIWEHGDKMLDVRRQMGVPEYCEDKREMLSRTLDGSEVDEVLARINAAAHLISNQSRDLRTLRRDGLIDGFAHVHLQGLLDELMTQQGKAERIKKFPFPRQYATVNHFFAVIFTLLVPLGMIGEFAALGEGMAWVTVPFSALIGWVFLTTDKIGDWSENPFEGLHNDVPISSMARGIERDIREMIGERELPPARDAKDWVLF
ncbi:MAG: multidrug transporter [Deltaproteobacteria bacterium]|nr:multidrug transporter [Deltaproteobacteria bacterium]